MAEQKAWRMDFDSVEGLAHKNKLDPPGFEAALAKDWVCAPCTEPFMLLWTGDLLVLKTVETSVW